MKQLVLALISALFQMEVFNAVALANLVLMRSVVDVERMRALHMLVLASAWKLIMII